MYAKYIWHIGCQIESTGGSGWEALVQSWSSTGFRRRFLRGPEKVRLWCRARVRFNRVPEKVRRLWCEAESNRICGPNNSRKPSWGVCSAWLRSTLQYAAEKNVKFNAAAVGGTTDFLGNGALLFYLHFCFSSAPFFRMRSSSPCWLFYTGPVSRCAWGRA